MVFTDDQITNLKLLLQIQADSYNDSINRLHQDIKEIKKENELRSCDLQRSLEFSQQEIDELKKELNSFKKENGKLKAEVDFYNDKIRKMTSKHEEMENKIDQIDDRQRRNNLILTGVDEGQNENHEQCQSKVTNILKDKFDIPNPDLNAAYRIGKTYNNKPRDILIKFHSSNQRDTVFRKKKILKGQQLFLNEDYCKNTSDIRKSLLAKVQEARNNGLYAYINYREIITRPLKSSSKRNSNLNTSRVQQAVCAIETTGAVPSSPIPSPRLQSTPCTPPPRRLDVNIPDESNAILTHLRPRSNIKYSK